MINVTSIIERLNAVIKSLKVGRDKGKTNNYPLGKFYICI